MTKSAETICGSAKSNIRKTSSAENLQICKAIGVRWWPVSPNRRGMFRT